MTHRIIRVGSRGSDLALWQARYISDQLSEIGLNSEIQIIKTRGDQIQDLSFDKIEGKGFFTKEIEMALLDDKVDLAVHSLKDLESQSPKGLMLAAYSKRADARDLLISKVKLDGDKKLGLPSESKVGTSSARRKSQLLALRPDLEILDLRGNVPTRIQKLRDGGYDAIVLAKAGLDRLGLDVSDLNLHPLDSREFVPAPAQGTLGLQIRSSDVELKNILIGISDTETAELCSAERYILQKLEGGCQMPLGVFCTKENSAYRIDASFAKSWDEPRSLINDSGADLQELSERVMSALLKIKNS